MYRYIWQNTHSLKICWNYFTRQPIFNIHPPICWIATLAKVPFLKNTFNAFYSYFKTKESLCLHSWNSNQWPLRNESSEFPQKHFLIIKHRCFEMGWKSNGRFFIVKVFSKSPVSYPLHCHLNWLFLSLLCLTRLKLGDLGYF